MKIAGSIERRTTRYTSAWTDVIMTVKIDPHIRTESAK